VTGPERTGLISNVIRGALNIECAVLMGANVAREVSIECFCEATIGQSSVMTTTTAFQFSSLQQLLHVTTTTTTCDYYNYYM